METKNGFVISFLIVAVLLSLDGCSGMSTQNRDTAIGAGAGAVGGAVLTGGSAVGTVGGANQPLEKDLAASSNHWKRPPQNPR